MDNPTPSAHDFWYAVNFTELVVVPQQTLETFGNTMISYHLITEAMDAIDKIRIREGRIEAFKPQIISPQDVGKISLEGFEQIQAADYANWLHNHFPDMMMLKYGFSIRKQDINDHIVTDRKDNVVESVKKSLTESNLSMNALVVGVEEPWEVCLMKLVVEMIQRSIPKHFTDLRADPEGKRNDIERAFLAAASDKDRIPELQQKLQSYRVFDDYQDRFFSLVRSFK